jgi:glutamate formiminotransferase
MAIVMCVPNISEGRDSATVEAVAAAVRATPGVTLLNYSSDPHHHRSVLTFLGEPDAVLQAARALTDVALARIDMQQHHGSHPRLGAVDVVPFVPVRGLDMTAAVELARRYGRYVGALGVPVYYYEEAATRPERVNLADIRKGEYESLPERLRDARWQPDEGPAQFNPRSGATVTGARHPLIAFNVNLRTNDLAIAQRIARAVRHISGGYRHVRAIGLALEDRGMVQVSMNLTNYARTPLPRVLETIRFEAARHGVNIAGTEIIGSLPLAALEEIVQHYLQAHDFSIEQVIEAALIEAAG